MEDAKDAKDAEDTSPFSVLDAATNVSPTQEEQGSGSHISSFSGLDPLAGDFSGSTSGLEPAPLFSGLEPPSPSSGLEPESSFAGDASGLESASDFTRLEDARDSGLDAARTLSLAADPPGEKLEL